MSQPGLSPEVAREVYLPRHAQIENPRYDLGEEAVHGLVTDYLQKEEGLPSGLGRFVGVRVLPDQPLSNAARWVEGSVFDGAFNNDSKVMEGLYQGVERDSTWFLVIDRHKKMPAGTMRVVGRESAQSMTLAEAPKYIEELRDREDRHEDLVEVIKDRHGIEDGQNLWDAATVAIIPEYRRKPSLIKPLNSLRQGMVVAMLERMFVREGAAQGIDKVLTMLDVKANRGLRDVGVPLEPLLGGHEPFEFYGSPATRAMIGNFADFLPSVTGRHEEIDKESFFLNVLKMGVVKALYRRQVGKIAGMAALGHKVDKRIKLSAPTIP